MNKKSINLCTALLFMTHLLFAIGFYIFLYIDTIQLSYVILSYMPLITMVIYCIILAPFDSRSFDKTAKKYLSIVVITLFLLFIQYLSMKILYPIFQFELWVTMSLLLMIVSIVFHFKFVKVFNSINNDKIVDYIDHVQSINIDFLENKITKRISRIIFTFRVLCTIFIGINHLVAFIVCFFILVLFEIVLTIWVYKTWKNNEQIMKRYDKIIVVQYLLYSLCLILIMLRKTTFISIIILFNNSFPFLQGNLHDFYYEQSTSIEPNKN